MVPGLAALLKDKDPGVRRHALADLESIGPAATQAVPALLEALGNKENPWWELQTLNHIGAASSVIVPVLAQHLVSTNLNQLLFLVDALGNYGTNAKVAVPSLTPFLLLTNAGLRSATIKALSKIDPKAIARADAK
jgi:HEAT repeat protein